MLIKKGRDEDAVGALNAFIAKIGRQKWFKCEASPTDLKPRSFFISLIEHFIHKKIIIYLFECSCASESHLVGCIELSKF